MKKELKIAIDIDDVLFPFVPELIKFHNKKYGTFLTMKNFISYDFWNVWGGNKEQAIRKVKEFFREYSINKVKPIKNSYKVINNLNKKNKLYIITSRQNEFEDVTHQWIDKFFPKIFEKIYLCNHYNLKGRKMSKSGICQKENINLIIDDNLKYIVESRKIGVKTLLFGNYPWNQNTGKIDDITRVNNWKEVLRYLTIT